MLRKQNIPGLRPRLFEYQAQKIAAPGAKQKTRLTISGKFTGEISLATQGKRPPDAAE